MRDVSGAGTQRVDILSIDVEDYFHVEAFVDVVDRQRWDEYPSRVETNTLKVLDLCSESSVTGTFFVLGWVAERYPGLVREIAARGHEIACHSYWHRLVYSLSPVQFKEDTLRAKSAIEDAVSTPVLGYRAPSFSVVKKSWWALEVLAELGFRYDSSVFPVRHDMYGIPDAPRAPFRVDTPAGAMIEFPMTTFQFAGGPNLPIGGGGYLRIFPELYTRFGIQRARRSGVPVIAYAHPWEIDPDQPRLPGRAKSRLRHYTNLSKMAGRLSRLIEGGHFTSFRDSGLIEATLSADSQLVSQTSV
jgi:polysaccharide deacetylase family protein (PEP-CTERM system associated)